MAVLRIFAARAAAEMLRLRLEVERAQANDMLRRSQMAENLRDILVVLNSDSTLDRILEQLVVRAQHILEADEAMLCRDEPERCLDALRPRLHHPATAHAILGVMVQAAETRLPAALADLAGLPPAPRATLGEHPSLHGSDIFRGLLVIPLVVDEALYGCIILYYVAPRPFSSEDLSLAGALSEHVVLAIENAQLREQARQMAAMEERNRIARELHDAVSQTLWSANLIADVLPDIFEQNAERGRFKLNQFRQLTRAALIEMRSLLLELRPNALVETALSELLARLTETISARSGLPIRLTTEGDCPLPPDVQITVYRIAQEAINNAVRHASAAHIEVLLHCAPERFELTVMDDGRGFDTTAQGKGHHGLEIMSERAASIGGHLRIASQFDNGTVVQFHWKPS
jgi:signal transduction histidine kinase